jgi:type IV secretion system protein VirD4
MARLVNRRMKLNPNEQYAVYEVDVTGEETDIEESGVNEDIDMDILNYDDLDDPDALA